MLGTSYPTLAGPQTGWAPPCREPACSQPQYEQVLNVQQLLAAGWTRVAEQTGLPPHMVRPPSSYQPTLNRLPGPPPLQPSSSYGSYPIENRGTYQYRP